MKKCMSREIFITEYCYRILEYIELLRKLLWVTQKLYNEGIIDFNEYYDIKKELANEIRNEFSKILDKLGIKKVEKHE